MKISIKNNRFSFLAFNIIYLAVTAFLFQIVCSSAYFISNWAVVVALCAVMGIFIQVLQLVQYKVSILDFRFLFMLLHYLFIYGRVFVIAFLPRRELFWDLTRRFSDETMLSMGLFSVCAIQAIFVGLMISYFSKDAASNNGLQSEKPNKAILITGVVCLLIGVPCSLIADRQRILTTYLTGSYRNMSLNIGIVDDIAPLMLAGVLLIISSNMVRKRGAFSIAILTMLYYGVIMLRSGDRRYQVAAILSVGCFVVNKFKTNNKTKIGTKLVLAILAVMGLNFLYIIREFRAGGLQEIGRYILTNPLSLFSMDFFAETLSEFGISFFSLCNVGKYIPSMYSFQFGRTFIVMFGALLPLGLMKDVSFYDAASYSDIINLREGAPVGATMIGDFYINFGWFSLILIVLFCYGISRFIESRGNLSEHWIQYKTYIGYYVFLSLVRSAISQSIRPLLFLVVFPFILYRCVVSFLGAEKRSA